MATPLIHQKRLKITALFSNISFSNNAKNLFYKVYGYSRYIIFLCLIISFWKGSFCVVKCGLTVASYINYYLSIWKSEVTFFKCEKGGTQNGPFSFWLGLYMYSMVIEEKKNTCKTIPRETICDQKDFNWKHFYEKPIFKCKCNWRAIMHHTAKQQHTSRSRGNSTLTENTPCKTGKQWNTATDKPNTGSQKENTVQLVAKTTCKKKPKTGCTVKR